MLGRMSSWSCPHQVNDLCARLKGAWCRPGMKGCVLFGKVVFEDGIVPAPRWPAPGEAPPVRKE